ncbi:MAG: ABC transporter permease [Anaerolineae bacterium]|nr:ABC transporter permease [Anaerolineae bacterium]
MIRRGFILQYRQVYAFVARNFALVRRYWGWELVWICYSVASSVSISFIGLGVQAVDVEGVVQDQFANFLVAYLVIGTLMWGFMSNIFNNLSEMIAWERWEGTIEYTFMAPVSRIVQMIGQMAFSVLYSILYTIIIGFFLALFFSIDLSQADFLGALLVVLVGSFSIVGIGVLGSILPLLYPERGAQLIHIIQAALLLFSGVYYPIEVLPGWMQFASQFSPATYVLAAMRYTLLPDSGVGMPVGEAVPPLLVMGAVMLPLGVWAFHRAEIYAKKHGKLKRNG